MKQLLSLTLCFLLICCSFASNGPHQTNPVKKYKQSHIRPVLLEQRKKLDLMMDASDKQKVALLRKQLQELRDKYGLKKLNPCDRKNLPEEQKKAMKAERKIIIDQAKVIAEKYRPAIEQLHAEIAVKEIQWKQDLEKIRASDTSTSACKPKKHLSPQFKPVRFLLMETEAKINVDANETGGVIASLSPNPGDGHAVLSYELKQSARVSIDIYNETGMRLTGTTISRRATALLRLSSSPAHSR